MNDLREFIEIEDLNIFISFFYGKIRSEIARECQELKFSKFSFLNATICSWGISLFSNQPRKIDENNEVDEVTFSITLQNGEGILFTLNILLGQKIIFEDEIKSQILDAEFVQIIKQAINENYSILLNNLKETINTFLLSDKSTT